MIKVNKIVHEHISGDCKQKQLKLFLFTPLFLYENFQTTVEIFELREETKQTNDDFEGNEGDRRR